MHYPELITKLHEAAKNKMLTFDLGGNELTALPPEIGQLTNLIRLNLQENPLPIPPEILGTTNEPATLLNYYFTHQAGQKKSLNAAKVIFVGQGSVGKTVLVRGLIEGRFDQYENKTEGVDIKQWPLLVHDDEIRLHVWNFGGQEIRHATHQCFLTRRSL